jgi:2-polyprenyl-6-methoxyphenol hydroxylase-like FAD-dependent oxidoreductase
LDLKFVNSSNRACEFQVTVELENGQKYEGDLLVGADGIWSKVL